MNVIFGFEKLNNSTSIITKIRNAGHGRPFFYYPPDSQPFARHKEYVTNKINGEIIKKEGKGQIWRRSTVQVTLKGNQISDYVDSHEKFFCPVSLNPLTTDRAWLPAKPKPLKKFNQRCGDPHLFIAQFRENFKHLEDKALRLQLLTFVHHEDKAEFRELIKNETPMEDCYKFFYEKAKIRNRKVDQSRLTIEEAGSLENFVDKLYDHASRYLRLVGKEACFEYILTRLTELSEQERNGIECQTIRSLSSFRDLICYKYHSKSLINSELITSYSAPLPSVSSNAESMETEEDNQIASFGDMGDEEENIDPAQLYPRQIRL